MRIVVTGGSGHLGTFVVRELLAQGHEPIPIDVKPGRDESIPATKIADLTKFDQVLPLFEKVDAICHLGNFPGFSEYGPSKGFENNVVSTFNVFQAADTLGIKRIVSASSIQVYGVLPGGKLYRQAYSVKPKYLPLDEDHPVSPCNAYPLSKSTGEALADGFVRRDPELTVYSLRITLVRRRTGGLPPDATDHDAHFAKTMHTYIHVADAARCIRMCCEQPRPGHTALNVGSMNSNPEWRPDLIEKLFGFMPPFKKEIARNQTLFCVDRAREVLGFVAEF